LAVTEWGERKQHRRKPEGFPAVLRLIWYTVLTMPPRKNAFRQNISEKLANKTFYRFLFSFIAVVAGVLLFILLIGTGGEGVQ